MTAHDVLEAPHVAVIDMAEGRSEYSRVASTPGVCGGAACILHTRIPIWVLEQLRRLGAPESDILQSYPRLQSADLAQAWDYVAGHREEIDQEIRENEEEP